MFGYPIEGAEELKRYWGARAIYKGYSADYYIDLLRDRQSGRGVDNAFLDWINNRALPWLRKEVKRAVLEPHKREEVVLREFKYELKANTNASHGYLYIGAAEHEVEEIKPVMNRAVQKEERVFLVNGRKLVWGAEHDPPGIGTQGNVPSNERGPAKVVGYFEEGYTPDPYQDPEEGDDKYLLLCLWVDYESPPEWMVNQLKRDRIKEAVIKCRLKCKRGTQREDGIPAPRALKEWEKENPFEMPHCICWDGDFEIVNQKIHMHVDN